VAALNIKDIFIALMKDFGRDRPGVFFSAPLTQF
jgi:hypothetical protein